MHKYALEEKLKKNISIVQKDCASIGKYFKIY